MRLLTAACGSGWSRLAQCHDAIGGPLREATQPGQSPVVGTYSASHDTAGSRLRHREAAQCASAQATDWTQSRHAHGATTAAARNAAPKDARVLPQYSGEQNRWRIPKPPPPAPYPSPLDAEGSLNDLAPLNNNAAGYPADAIPFTYLHPAPAPPPAALFPAPGTEGVRYREATPRHAPTLAPAFHAIPAQRPLTRTPPCASYEAAGTVTGVVSDVYRQEGSAIGFFHVDAEAPRNYSADFHHFAEAVRPNTEEVDFAHITPQEPATWVIPSATEIVFAHGCQRAISQPLTTWQVPRLRVRWREATPRHVKLKHGWGPLPYVDQAANAAGDGWESDLPSTSTTTPRRRVYIVTATVSIIRVSDNTEIPCASASISASRGDTAIAGTFMLLGDDALDTVRIASGEPTEIQATINGEVWRFLITSYSVERAHGTLTITAQGYSHSILLGAPWLAPASYTETQERTIAQLADDLMPDGYTLVWQAADWTVPAGAWSYRAKTPMQALAALASAAGAVIVPSRTAKTITVRPAYPVLPWDYGSEPGTIIVPQAAMLGAQHQAEQAIQADRVFVYGGEIGGILAQCTLSGEAGDRLATDAQDNLITHVDGARARAETVLGDLWAKPELLGITTPVDASTHPVPAISDLLQATIGATTTKGTITSVVVTVAPSGRGGKTIRQSIGIRAGGQNAFAAFAALTAEPTQIGTVATVHGDGTCTVTLPSGAALRVRGSASQGATVWVRAGWILGTAPSMSPTQITI